MRVTADECSSCQRANKFLTLPTDSLRPSSTTVTNNYGIDPNYRVAYVQMWNLNMQHELTPTLLLNVGYTGSKGSALDMLRAPNRAAGWAD